MPSVRRLIACELRLETGLVLLLLLPGLSRITLWIDSHWSCIKLLLNHSLWLLCGVAHDLWLTSTLLQMLELLFSLAWLEHQ